MNTSLGKLGAILAVLTVVACRVQACQMGSDLEEHTFELGPPTSLYAGDRTRLARWSSDSSAMRRLTFGAMKLEVDFLDGMSCRVFVYFIRVLNDEELTRSVRTWLPSLKADEFKPVYDGELAPAGAARSRQYNLSDGSVIEVRNLGADTSILIASRNYLLNKTVFIGERKRGSGFE